MEKEEEKQEVEMLQQEEEKPMKLRLLETVGERYVMAEKCECTPRVRFPTTDEHTIRCDLRLYQALITNRVMDDHSFAQQLMSDNFLKNTLECLHVAVTLFDNINDLPEVTVTAVKTIERAFRHRYHHLIHVMSVAKIEYRYVLENDKEMVDCLFTIRVHDLLDMIPKSFKGVRKLVEGVQAKWKTYMKGSVSMVNEPYESFAYPDRLQVMVEDYSSPKMESPAKRHGDFYESQTTVKSPFSTEGSASKKPKPSPFYRRFSLKITTIV